MFEIKRWHYIGRNNTVPVRRTFCSSVFSTVHLYPCTWLWNVDVNLSTTQAMTCIENMLCCCRCCLCRRWCHCCLCCRWCFWWLCCRWCFWCLCCRRCRYCRCCRWVEVDAPNKPLMYYLRPLHTHTRRNAGSSMRCCSQVHAVCWL